MSGTQVKSASPAPVDDISAYIPTQADIDNAPNAPGLVTSIKAGLGQQASSAARALKDVPVVGGSKAVERLGEYGDEVQRNNPTEIHSLADVAADPVQTVKEGAGNALSQAPAMAAGGTAGRLIGGMLGRRFGGAPGQKLGEKLGGYAGSALPTLLQEYGGIRQEQDQAGIDDKAQALKAAVPATAIEFGLGPQRGIAHMIGEGFEGTTRQLAKKLAQETAGMSKADAAKYILKYAGKEIGRQSLEEGGEELVQNPIEAWGAHQDPFSPEVMDQAATGAVLGAVGGAALGAGPTALKHVGAKRMLETEPGAQPQATPAPQQPPVVQPVVQPVVPPAPPAGPLGRAAQAGGSVAAAMQPAPVATPVDPIEARLGVVSNHLGDNDYLSALRRDSRVGNDGVTDLLHAWTIARNPTLSPDVRDFALASVEQTLGLQGLAPSGNVAANDADTIRDPIQPTANTATRGENYAPLPALVEHGGIGTANRGAAYDEPARPGPTPDRVTPPETQAAPATPAIPSNSPSHSPGTADSTTRGQNYGPIPSLVAIPNVDSTNRGAAYGEPKAAKPGPTSEHAIRPAVSPATAPEEAKPAPAETHGALTDDDLERAFDEAAAEEQAAPSSNGQATAQAETPAVAANPVNQTAPQTPDRQPTAPGKRDFSRVRGLVGQGYTQAARTDVGHVLTNPTTGESAQISPAEFAAAREAIRKVEQAKIDTAAHAAATSQHNDLPEPTDAQKQAGNYRKSDPIDFHGLKVRVENPKGSERSGTSPNGEKWAVTMPAHYGDIKRTEGADGDNVDIYLGEHPNSNRVYVIDQVDADTGKFDEHKVFANVPDREAALKLYDAGFSDGRGPQRRGAVTPMSIDEFKEWIKSGDTKRPVSQAFDENGTLKREAPTTTAEADKSAADTNKPAGETNNPETETPAAETETTDEPAPAQTHGDRRHDTEPHDTERRGEQRRKDEDRRRRVADMTPDELRRELLTNELTGIGNRRAYQEDERLPVQVSIDVDSLKWVNDTTGHESGDRMLKAIAQALADETPHAYHISGDEFIVQANTNEEAREVMQRAQARLDAANVTVTKADGTKISFTGLGFSYGTGTTLDDAEEGLHAHKSEREAQGLRAARGEKPAGASIESGSGQGQHAGSDAAAEEVALPATPDSKYRFIQFQGNAKAVPEFEDITLDALPGIPFFVHPTYDDKGEKLSTWNVTHNGSGLAVYAGGKTKQDAIDTANDRVAKLIETKGPGYVHKVIGDAKPLTDTQKVEALNAAESAGEKEAPKPPSKTTQATEQTGKAPLFIEEYGTDKIIVRGDTRTYKDRIKAIRGSWWNKSAGGWTFYKRKEAEVRAALADLLPGAAAAEKAPEPSAVAHETPQSEPQAEKPSTGEPQAEPVDAELAKRWDAMSYGEREAIAQASEYGPMRNVVHRIAGSKWQALVESHEAREITKAIAKLDADKAATEDDAAKRAKISAARRALDLDLFNGLTAVPELLNAARNSDRQNFIAEAVKRAKDWITDEVIRAAQANDAGRIEAINDLNPETGVITPPESFYDGLHREMKQRVAAEKQEAIRAAAASTAAERMSAREIDPESREATQFMQGWEAALAGKVRSNLPVGGRYGDGFDDATAWTKTDEGKAALSGKRQKKLENTGADLRRWYDEVKRKLAESRTEIDDIVAQIEEATSRADLFRSVLAEDATPGAQRWLDMLRNNIETFKETVTSSQSSASPTEQIREYLKGSRWSTEALKEGSSIEERAATLRSVAQDYVDGVMVMTEALQGSKNIDELVSRADAFLWDANNKQKLTAAGGRYMRYSRNYYALDRLLGRGESWTLRKLREKESDPLTSAKKQALVPPRLDSVDRDGGEDYRKGENVTPEQFKEALGFADVGFGKWVNARGDREHLNFSFDAFHDLAKLLGLPAEAMGLGGQLHFTIGALGSGKFAAHYQKEQPHPDGGSVPVINVTNTRGDGTVSHEWLHALDLTNPTPALKAALDEIRHDLTYAYDMRRVRGSVENMLRGSSYWRGDMRSSKTDEGRLENALRAIEYYAKNERQQTEFYKEALKLESTKSDPYWSNGKELLARAFEAWVGDVLEHQNTYLVNPSWVGEGIVNAKTHRGTPYPTGEERERFNAAFSALAKSLVYKDGKVTIDREKWDANRPDMGSAWRQALADLREELPQMQRDMARAAEIEREQAEARQREEADKKAAEADEEARKAREALDRMEAEKAVEQAAEQPPAPPVGDLSDADLERAFDEAAAELADTTAEDPEVPAPGEAAQLPDRWTREDFEHLRQLVADGKIVLVAEHDLGLPTIHDYSKNAKHLGFGTFKIETPEYEAIMDGGGAMSSTPSGRPYTVVGVNRGTLPYDRDVVLAKLDEYLGAPKAPAVPEPGKEMTQLERDMIASGRLPPHETYFGHGPNEGKRLARVYSGVHDGLVGVGNNDEEARLDLLRLIEASEQSAARSETLPTLDDEAQKTASQLASEAAKLGVKGIEESLKGLAKLFGCGPGRLSSFPGGIDEDTYKAAKPHFEAALRAFQEAGKSIKDLFRFLIQQFGLGIKPYALRFAKEKALSADLGQRPSAVRSIAQYVRDALRAGGDIRWRDLFGAADAAYGKTQAEGGYTPKDAYDAMEMGVNLYLREGNWQASGDAADAAQAARNLTRMIQSLPTQTRRDKEMDEFQQFSTPPALAYVANWVANVSARDTMMEPSAGTGDLAIYADNAGARIVLNELSSRRAAILRELYPNAQLFTENAEQLNNILPADVRPSVVVMNPPFSSTAGRVDGQRNTMNGAKHIEQALKRLAEGGRLVAIVGEGMAADRPAFKAWWKDIARTYNVRANIGIDGQEYAKYGTTFSNQILVIDKTGPTTGTVLTGKVDRVEELPALLEGVRNARRQPAEEDRGSEPATDQSGGAGVSEKDGLEKQPVGPANPHADDVGARGRRPGRAGDDVDGQDGVPGSAGGNDGVGSVPGGEARHGGKRGGGRGGSGRGGAGKGGDAGGRSGDAAGLPGVDAAESGVTLDKPQAPQTHEEELSGSVFENYTPRKARVAGAKAHPGKLVESAAMSSVDAPDPTYTPNLPKEVIKEGKLSDAQIETIIYAGQAHAQTLPDGSRRGFFIGDNTGVGKGREISGIILDNLRQGRKKAVWVSASEGLMQDAKRDFSGVGGDPSIIKWFGSTKTDADIQQKDGILFSTYATLRGGETRKSTDTNPVPPKTRVQQIVDWVGEDFDGVIVFDEAHSMGNALPMKGKRGTKTASQQALAGINLQLALPNARVVYVSATGATEVLNLAYATRLGLWGEGTPFNNVIDFVAKVDTGGVAAMELVSRDMKALGMYLARSLSFDGVTYAQMVHELTPLQTDIYNELARAWQLVLQNVNNALEDTGQDKDTKAKGAALSRFWSTHQRFFNQVITSLMTPTVIEDMQRQIDAGNAIVIQLVNTNEAEQNRQKGKAEQDGTPLEELDFTPRQALMDYVRNAYPVQQYEEQDDGNGGTKMVAVEDANGNPVFNQDAIRARDELLTNLENIRVPGNPIDEIINAFGSANVGEVTGRSSRFVREMDDDGNFKMVEEKRGKNAASNDAKAFQADKKKVLIFSQAGGTGFSFHADLGAENQRKRVHYVLQPGWRADNAVQGFGRTHRTNEKQPPHYILPTTNLKAQKRFVSSVARRLDQLGALTRGQRETTSQGMFSAEDNLENKYADGALDQFFTDLVAGTADGLDFAEISEAMGITNLIDKTGAINKSNIPEVPRFLNRLLSLRQDQQDQVFDAFFRRLQQAVDFAVSQGTYDNGLQTLRAESIKKVRDDVAYTDKRTGATTRYVELDVTNPVKFREFDQVAQLIKPREGDPPNRLSGIFRNEKTGALFGLREISPATDGQGVIHRRAAVYPITDQGYTRYVENVDEIAWGHRYDKHGNKIKTYSQVPLMVAREQWDKAVAEAPKKTTRRERVVVGVILPVWDRVTGHPRIYRMQTDTGERLLGRLLSQKDAKTTLKNLGLGSEAASLTPEQQIERIRGGAKAILGNGWRIERVRVSNDDRIEIILPSGYINTSDARMLTSQGAFIERHQFKERAFIPAGENELAVFKRVTESKPVVDFAGSKQAEDAADEGGDDAMASLGSGVTTNETPDSIRGALIHRFGEKTIAALEDGGLLKIVADAADVPAGLLLREPDADAIYDPRNKVAYLIANRLTGAIGPAKLLHEIGEHHSLEEVLGPKGWRVLAAKVRVMAKVDGSRAQAVWSAIKESYSEFAGLSDAALAQNTRFMHEVIAHLGESQAFRRTSVWRDLVAAIKAFLLKHFGFNGALTEADVGHLLEGSLKAAARNADMSSFTQADIIAANGGDILKSQPAPIWYSELARGVDRATMKRAPAGAWAQYINALKQKGVKPDEIELSGVLDWLKMQPGKVTKEQVSAFLRDNGVQVQDVVLGAGNVDIADAEARLRALGWSTERSPDGRAIAFTEIATPDDLMTAEDIELDGAAGDEVVALANQIEQLFSGGGADTQYGQYQLPGGKNYRELLLTLPDRTRRFSGWEIIDPDSGTPYMRSEDEQFIRKEAARRGGLDVRPVGGTMRDGQAGNFYANHFEAHTNILAHVRFNERESVTYSPEEASTLSRRADIEAKIKALDVDVKKAQKERHKDESAKLDEIREEVRAEMAAGQVPEGGIARAIEERFVALPKTALDARVNKLLAQRRALEESMPPEPKGNRQRVLFIEEAQSDWAQKGKKEGFKGRTEAEMVGGRLRQVTKADGVPSAPFVTKTEAWVALALKRMIRYAAEHGFDSIAWTTGEQQYQRYPEQDEEAGKKRDEGMRAFYNSIVPNVANDVLKKLGGGRVTEFDLGPSGGSLDFTGPGTQPGFAITPELRARALEGMPLFSKRADETVRVPSETANWMGFGALRLTANFSELAQRHSEYYGSTNEARQDVEFVLEKPDNWYAHADGRVTLFRDRTGGIPSARIDFRRERDGAYRIASVYRQSKRQIALAMKEKGESLRRVGLDPEHLSVAEFLDRSSAPSASASAPSQAESSVDEDNTGGKNGPMASVPLNLPEYLQSAAGRRSIRERVEDAFKSQRTFNSWWHKTVGSQYHKAQVDRDFRPVYELAQQYLDDTSRFANESADLAPHLLPKTEGLMDAVSGIANIARDARDAKAIAGPIFQGTLRDRVFTDAELRDPPEEMGKPLFEPLSDGQIKLYREYLSAVNHSLDVLATSELARLAKLSGLRTAPREAGLRDAAQFYREQYGDELDQLQRLVDDLTQAQAAERRMLEDAAEDEAGNADERKRYTRLRDDMRTRHAEEMKPLETKLRDLSTLDRSITSRVDQIAKLKSQGYAPLMRFGRYTVDVFVGDEDGKPLTDADGEDIRLFFGMFETEAEANKAARILREEYPKATVKQGVASDLTNKLFQGVTPETLDLFARLSGEEQSDLFQNYLKFAVNQRSAMKRLIHRLGIEGFERDPSRTLAAFLTSNARAASGNYHFGDMLRATAAIPKEKGDVKDEAIGLLTYLQNPREEAPAARSALFFNFLGGSVAAALVNMTQTFTTTLPYLHQFGGSTVGNLGSAMRLAGRRLVSKNVDVGNPELAEALKRAEEEGVVAPHEIHMLQGESTRSGVLTGNRLSRTFMKAWGSLFSLAERYNRDVAFMAAYKVAQEKKMDPEQAYAFARKAVNESQFVYSKASRGNWGRNALGATLMTFRTFTINYLEFLKRLPAKERALALAVLAVAAGLSGLPGADDLDDLTDTLAQGLGFDWDTAQQKEAAIAKVLGQDAAGFAMHGISYGLPLDVSARVGAGNLIPGTAILKRSETDKSRELMEWAGASGAMLRDMMHAYERVQSGSFVDPEKYFDALRKDLLPKAMKDVFQAFTMAQTGFYTDSLGRRVTEVDGQDALWKMIGFQPSKVARASEARQAVRQEIELVKAVKGAITAKWAQGVYEQDQGIIDEAREELQTWNRHNPEARIGLDPSAIRARVRALKLSADQRLVMTAPKQMRERLREMIAAG